MNSEAWAGVTAAAAGVKAGDQARVPAGVKVKTAVGSLNKLTNQPFKKSTPFKGGDLMPGFDRTGPMGAGPMTGGAGGRCNPATSTAIPAYSGGYGYGRGLGRRRGFRGRYGPDAGRGRGYGRGYGWYPPAAVPAYSAGTSDEMNMLKADADYMQKRDGAFRGLLAV